MKNLRLVRGIAVGLATWALCLPPVAFAADQVPTPAIADVAMADGGILHGQVVDLQGSGAAGVPVGVKTQNKPLVRTVSGPEGRFEVKDLRGGVYQVAAGDGQGVYRLWAAKAAPPSAQKNAIVYTQNAAPRGYAKMLLTNPIVVAGVVATAIAVPVALANSNSSSP